MKIFIDARMVKIGGTYTYANCLLEEILSQDSALNEYFILYNKGQQQVNHRQATPLLVPIANPLFWIIWDRFFLPKIIEKLEIDLFHSLRRPGGINGVRSKSILTLHSSYPFLYPYLQSKSEKVYWNRFLRKAAQEADAVLAVSEYDRQNLIRSLPLSPEKIIVHHLATDRNFSRLDDPTSLKKIRDAYQLPEKYFLFVGTFYYPKNIPNIIKAFECLKHRANTPHKLVLVGRAGSAAKQVRETIKNSPYHREIIETGMITDRLELRGIYSAADAFLFPTLYDSFGLPVLEAMNCGVPTLISSTGALSEVAGNASLICSPENIEAMADSMEQLATNSKLRAELIAKGHERIKIFSWERCAKETIAAYNFIGNRN